MFFRCTAVHARSPRRRSLRTSNTLAVLLLGCSIAPSVSTCCSACGLLIWHSLHSVHSNFNLSQLASQGPGFTLRPLTQVATISHASDSIHTAFAGAALLPRSLLKAQGPPSQPPWRTTALRSTARTLCPLCQRISRATHISPLTSRAAFTLTTLPPDSRLRPSLQ